VIRTLHVGDRKNTYNEKQLKDFEKVCVDPHNAGDLVTTGAYDWFELSLEPKR
jgi:hypothetical protein